MLLAALNRLEALMRADGTALERLRDELRLLLIAIRLARPDIDAASPLTKAAKLASLLDLMQRRIDAMVETKAVDLAPAAGEPSPTHHHAHRRAAGRRAGIADPLTRQRAAGGSRARA